MDHRTRGWSAQLHPQDHQRAREERKIYMNKELLNTSKSLEGQLVTDKEAKKELRQVSFPSNIGRPCRPCSWRQFQTDGSFASTLPGCSARRRCSDQSTSQRRGGTWHWQQEGGRDVQGHGHRESRHTGYELRESRHWCGHHEGGQTRMWTLSRQTQAWTLWGQTCKYVDFMKAGIDVDFMRADECVDKDFEKGDVDFRTWTLWRRSRKGRDYVQAAQTGYGFVHRFHSPGLAQIHWN